MWLSRDKSKLSKVLFIAFAMLLVVPLTFSCSKKDSPDVGYEDGSGDSRSSDRADSGGAYDGEDLGDSSGAKGLRTIYFDYDSAVLSPRAKKIISNNAQYLKSKKRKRITVEGHCDERGTTEYNLALGERRANAVRNYLVNLGVPKSRLNTISYGEERPATSGQSESSWSRNRRVEFTE